MKNLLCIFILLPLFAFGQDYTSLIDELRIQVNLDTGWNIIGYTCSQEIDVVEAISELSSQVEILKDNNGDVYWPEFGFNGIGNFVPGMGYQLKLLNPISNFSLNSNCYSVESILDDFAINIDLSLGWNIIAYTCIYEKDVVESLSEISSQVVILKDNNGDVYWPEYSFNGIGDFIPGMGYQLKLSNLINNFSLNDNCVSIGCMNSLAQNYDSDATIDQGCVFVEIEVDDFTEPINTGMNQNLLFMTPDLGQLNQGQLGAFYDLDEDGLMECVGLTTIDPGTFSCAVWGDDPVSPQKDGLSDGDLPFWAILYNGNIISADLIPQQLGYSHNGLQVITDIDLNGTITLECSDQEAENFLGVEIEDVDINYLGNCIYEGCMDELACNYEIQANEDSGECLYVWFSCEYCSGQTDGTGTILNNDDVCKYLFNNDNIHDAVSSWLSDSASAILIYDHISTWDVSNVTDMVNLFMNTNFNSDISNWDVSSVTHMRRMFGGAESFNGDLSNWDVSNVIGMFQMFQYATNFNSDISDWNVSNVTDMGRMFQDATNFNIDLSNWDVSSVNFTHNMFANTNFNGDLSSWDVSNVTNMAYMFNGLTSFNCDLSTWDVSNVTSMAGLFQYASSFNSDISSWDVSSVIYLHKMFKGASSFNQDISNWNVSSNHSFWEMFNGATSFNQDISNWNVTTWFTTIFTPSFQDMFLNTDNLSDENRCSIHSSFRNNSNWPYEWYDEYDCNDGCFEENACNYDNEADYDSGECFYPIDCETCEESCLLINDNNIHQVVDSWINDSISIIAVYGHISEWDVSNVTSMAFMFIGAEVFNSDISGWDVSSVTSMASMFGSAEVFNSDISDWDVSSVTDMSQMFSGAFAFNSDISDWDVSSVTNMSQMFINAVAFNSDISGWDVSSVESMFYMFYNVNQLSEQYLCSIHSSFSLNENWNYDWSIYCDE